MIPNWPKTIDWLDIAAHTAVAMLVALGMGIGAAAGLAHGGLWGWALVALALAGNAANSLYWPIRERNQKGGAWGGVQSHLEWIFPVAAAWITFGVVLAWA
jgi:hypothetical protein